MSEPAVLPGPHEELRLLARLSSFILGKGRAEVIKDTPSFSVLGVRYGPYKKGDKIELPRWLILALASEGYVYVVDEGLEVDVYRALSKERSYSQRGGQLAEVKENLYPRVLFMLLGLKLLGLREQENRLDASYQDLLTIRLSKIVKSLSYSGASTTLPNLSFEEKTLYEGLVKLVSRWRRIVRGESGWK